MSACGILFKFLTSNTNTPVGSTKVKRYFRTLLGAKPPTGGFDVSNPDFGIQLIELYIHDVIHLCTYTFFEENSNSPKFELISSYHKMVVKKFQFSQPSDVQQIGCYDITKINWWLISQEVAYFVRPTVISFMNSFILYLSNIATKMLISSFYTAATLRLLKMGQYILGQPISNWHDTWNFTKSVKTETVFLKLLI